MGTEGLVVLWTQICTRGDVIVVRHRAVEATVASTPTERNKTKNIITKFLTHFYVLCCVV